MKEHTKKASNHFDDKEIVVSAANTIRQKDLHILNLTNTIKQLKEIKPIEPRTENDINYTMTKEYEEMLYNKEINYNPESFIEKVEIMNQI